MTDKVLDDPVDAAVCAAGFQPEGGQQSPAATEVDASVEEANTRLAPDALPARGWRRWCAAANTSRNLAALLGAMMLAEAAVLSLDSVPWVIDKIYWLIALSGQALMGLYWPLRPCTSARCRSLLMDVCHWAFVVLVFSGVLILRSSASLLFVASVAALTVLLRRAMGNVCIITAVADVSSLPPISANAVNVFFGGLLLACVLRLILAAVFGEGWPVVQAFEQMGFVSAVHGSSPEWPQHRDHAPAGDAYAWDVLLRLVPFDE